MVATNCCDIIKYLSNMVNPLSSKTGTALLGLAAARPAFVSVSPDIDEKGFTHDTRVVWKS